MPKLVILKTVKVGLESLDSADEMRMVRCWQRIDIDKHVLQTS